MTRSDATGSAADADSSADEHASPRTSSVRPWAGRTATVSDHVLDATVVVLATWTVVYHASLLLGLSSDTALLVESLLLATALTLARPRQRPAPQEPQAPEGGVQPHEERVRVDTTRTLALRTTWGAAGVAAVSMALDLPWLLVWVPWLVAAGAALVAVLAGSSRGEARSGPPERVVGALEAGLVLAAAAVLALFAMVTLRPNPDDLYYVNLSQWIAAHGSFPLRDTIFADLVYPMSNWPPLASYDALTGALAHVLHVPAGDIVYVVVPPLMTALAVLALWRLLRAWRIRHVVVAMAFGLLFLLVDGTSSYASPGNLFLTRLWQGKVILLCLVVPVLLVHALAYVEQPTRRRLGWLALGGAAAVACSTTAIFLVPIIAAAGAAPLVLASPRGARLPRQAVAGFAAMAAYPVAAGVVTLALGGRSADEFGERRQYRFDPAWFGHEVFLTNGLAVVGVLAVLLGALVLPRSTARVTTALLVLATGVTFIPGFTRLAYDVVGLGPTLWRVTWGCTVAALVGALASNLWQRAPSSRVAVVGAVAAAIVLVLVGRPIWSSDTSTSLHWPPHWQRSADAQEVTDWIIARHRPGARVLAPDGLAITVAVTSTDVKTVAPRDYYLSYLREDPDFDFDDRLLLVDFVNGVPGRREDVQRPLEALDVETACVYRTDLRGAALLRAAGYRRGLVSSSYQCFVR